MDSGKWSGAYTPVQRTATVCHMGSARQLDKALVLDLDGKEGSSNCSGFVWRPQACTLHSLRCRRQRGAGSSVFPNTARKLK